MGKGEKDRNKEGIDKKLFIEREDGEGEECMGEGKGDCK